MKRTVWIILGRTPSAADLTLEVCLGLGFDQTWRPFHEPSVLIDLSRRDRSHTKRLKPPLALPKTPSVVPPPHNISLRMHHTRVPRG